MGGPENYLLFVFVTTRAEWYATAKGLRVWRDWQACGNITQSICIERSYPMETGLDLSNPEESAHDLSMHLHAENADDSRGNLWAYIAANAHTVSYDYQRVLHFIEWANAYQLFSYPSGNKWVPLPVPLPDAIEYLEILEFRCRSLQEARHDPDKRWEWPARWGGGKWNCPVINSSRKVLDDPWRSPPRLEQAIEETAEAIVLHKRQMGHGAPVTLSATERLLVSEMLNLFVGSPRFTVIPRLPPIRLSLDEPPALRFMNEDQGLLDTDRLLGEYDPGGHGEVVIYERGLRHCSQSLDLPVLALRELCLAHELAHWISDQIPLSRPTIISHQERWYGLRLVDGADGKTSCLPSRLEKTEKNVHEGWAQLLTYYTLTMAYNSHGHYKTYLDHPRGKGDVSDPYYKNNKDEWPGYLYAFLELNGHQSSPYRVWKEILDLGKTPREVIETLPELRVADPGATMALWRSLLT
jgi:hypothetical protein